MRQASGDKSARAIVGLMLACLLAMGARAEVLASDTAAEPQRPGYATLRQDEDWSFLKDPSRRTDVFDPLKYIPLALDGEVYLTLGGSARLQYEYTQNPAWGQDLQDKRGVWLQRYLFNADLHVTKYLRLYGEMQSAWQDGREGGPAPSDEDQLDPLQLFAEIAAPLDRNAGANLRAGRQELVLGSGRLVNVREGPNTRRPFNALRGWIYGDLVRVDFLLARPVLVKRYAFDNEPNPLESLWGFYAVLDPKLLAIGGLDLYWLGYWNERGKYQQGKAEEKRHSVGFRFWGEGPGQTGLDYNFEGIYQFGTFGKGLISAWTLASITGYTFPLPWTPRLALSANIASGDQNPNDTNIETFNPLFPRGNYFSELSLLGPRNFYDLHPFLTVKPLKPVSITVDIDFFWRQSLNDGIYTPSGGLLRASGGSKASYVGTTTSLTGEWAVTDHLTATAIYSNMQPGDFIHQTGKHAPIELVQFTLKFTF